jgi:4'-phosphopantetheinyl transferase
LAIGTAPVGLDVERVDSAQDVDGVAGMSLAPEELQVLKRYDGAAKARAFTRYWTRKEALLKATGDGIAAGLWTVVVSAPDEPAGVVRWDSGPAQLHDLEIDNDHLAALAVLSAEPLHVISSAFDPHR